MGVSVFDRVYPLRKPKGFEPVVQRWSVALPNRYDRYFVSFFGTQAEKPEELKAAPLFAWFEKAKSLPHGPVAHDHSEFVDEQGLYTRIIAAYWIDSVAYESWAGDPFNASWWDDPARIRETCGYFRECLTVPLDRQETLYWQDYPVALSKAEEVSIYPTPYCGYYGAMYDRMPITAVDRLKSPLGNGLPAPEIRESRGARWRVNVPNNLAVIRSGVSWEKCDDEQYADFMTSLRKPLDKGMDYLHHNPGETGCCSLRYLQTCDAAGEPLPESHAIGYFLSIDHLENWAQRHASHHAIFAAAMARYKKYGKANQLRTWHEVYVLPEAGQKFEYINCAPKTGLLPYFNAQRTS